MRSKSKLSWVFETGSKKIALQAEVLRILRISATVANDWSTSTTLSPILAAASNVTCFSAESGNHNAKTSPLTNPCSSNALACASTKCFTSVAVHLRFLAVYRTASRCGSDATLASNCVIKVDCERQEITPCENRAAAGLNATNASLLVYMLIILILQPLICSANSRLLFAARRRPPS